MKTILRLFLDWGITFEIPYETEEKSHRKVYYANKEELEENIMRQTMALKIEEEDEIAEESKRGGTLHSRVIERSKESVSKSKTMIRT